MKSSEGELLLEIAQEFSIGLDETSRARRLVGTTASDGGPRPATPIRRWPPENSCGSGCSARGRGRLLEELLPAPPLRLLDPGIFRGSR